MNNQQTLDFPIEGEVYPLVMSAELVSEVAPRVASDTLVNSFDDEEFIESEGSTTPPGSSMDVADFTFDDVRTEIEECVKQADMVTGPVDVEMWKKVIYSLVPRTLPVDVTAWRRIINMREVIMNRRAAYEPAENVFRTEQVAELLGIGTSSVYPYLSELLNRGLIVRTKKRLPGSTGDLRWTSCYIIPDQDKLIEDFTCQIRK